MLSENITHITVRYAETDQMRMVHHSAYMLYMEEARTLHLKKLGFPYHRLEEQGFFLPVVELKVNYLKPARYGDEIHVRSVLGPVEGVRLRVDYEIFRDSEKLAEGYTLLAFVGPSGKPVRPPLALTEALGR